MAQQCKTYYCTTAAVDYWYNSRPTGIPVDIGVHEEGHESYKCGHEKGTHSSVQQQHDS